MQYYSVRQFCDMVGVPYSSLRYYERIGLLSPKQDEVNNYRLYTVQDAFLLNRFKNYRALGFEVKEAMEIIKNDCNKDLAQKMNVLEENLKTQLVLIQEQLKKVEELKGNLTWLENDDVFRIEQLEDKWFLPASDGSDFTVAKFEEFSKWVDLLPTTTYCKRIKHQSTLKKDYGISINTSDSYLLDEELLVNADFIKGGRCLMFLSNKLKNNDDLDEGLKEAFRYMKEQNLTQTGDIYLQGATFKDREGMSLDFVFIPIL